jgi:hypothetical protein
VRPEHHGHGRHRRRQHQDARRAGGLCVSFFGLREPGRYFRWYFCVSFFGFPVGFSRAVRPLCKRMFLSFDFPKYRFNFWANGRTDEATTIFFAQVYLQKTSRYRNTVSLLCIIHSAICGLDVYLTVSLFTVLRR